MAKASGSALHSAPLASSVLSAKYRRVVIPARNTEEERASSSWLRDAGTDQSGDEDPYAVVAVGGP